MNTPAIEILGLTRTFGKTDAVRGLSMRVEKGCCYGFFGRNGAGKTTTIKCLLNLLRPTAGSVKIFGYNPAREELEVKSRLAYVPDTVAFYPWRTVRQALEYFASFRRRWNQDTEKVLLRRFELPPDQKASDLSKGQRTQLALVAAVCPEPEMLVLDEPTSGLDPIVRREFIETVIGAYQSTGENRTVFVSTHLIGEFEGLIDRFTIIDQGRELLTMNSDDARERFKMIRVRFAEPPAEFAPRGALRVTRKGRDFEILANGDTERLLAELRAAQPEDLRCDGLSLEEIFVSSKDLSEK